uniref:Uncharacterized protein n=1 Tax=Cacopsylla melanoneura TaxID=428564 RepID=A0A8D8XDM3_9HEMI
MYLLSDGKLENPEESLLSELVNPEESLLSDGKLENPEESTQFRGDLQLMTPKEDKEIEDFIDKQNKDTTEVIELAQNLDDLKERLKGFEADRKLKEKALAEVVQKKEIGVLASEDHAKREAEENERKRKEEDERKKIEEKLRQENERKRREAELDEEIERKRKEAELKEEIERKRREKELQEEQVRKEKELIESQQREKEIEEENNRKLREQEVLDKKLKEEEARKLMEQEAKDIEKRRQLDFIERERKENELLLSQAKEVQFPDVSDAHVQTIPSNKEDTMVQTIPFGSEHTMVQTAPLSLKQTQTSFTSQEKQEEVQHKPVQTEKEDEPDKAHKYTEKKSKKSPKTSKDKAVSSQKGVKTETTTTDAIKVETDVLKQVPVITEIVDDTVTLIVDTTVSKSPEQIVGEKVQAEKDPKTKKSLQRSDRVQETYTLEKVTQAPSVDDKSVEPSEKVTSTPDTSHTDETVPAKNEANGVKVAAPKSSKNKDVPASKEKDTPSKKKSPKKQKSDQSVSSDISVDSKGKQKPHLLEKVSKYFSKSSKKKSKESPSSSFEEYKSQDLSISDSVQSKVPESDTPIKSSDLDLEQVSAVEVALKVNVKDSDEPQTPSTTEEKVDIRTDSTPSVEEKVTEKPVSTIKQTQTSFSSQEQDELNKQNLQHPGRTTTLPTQTSETPIDVSDDTSSGKPQYNVEAEVRLDKQTKRPKKPTDKKKDVTSSTVLESKPAAEIGSSNVSSTDDLTNTDELKINITAQIDTKDSEDSKLQDSDVDRPEVQKTSAKITKKIFGVFKKQKDVPSEKSAKQKESSPTPTEKLSESSPTKDTDGKKDFHDVLQKGKKLSKALLKKAVDPRLHESPEEQSYSVTTPLTLDDGVVQIEEVTADVPESSVSTVNIQTTPGQDTFQQVSTQVVTYPEKDFETTVRSIKSGTTYQISEGVSRSLVTKSVIQQTSTSSSDFDDKSKPIIEILPSETTYQISDDGTTRSIITKSVIQQTSTSSSDLDNTSKPIIEMASIDLSDPLLTRVESVTSTQVHDPVSVEASVQITDKDKGDKKTVGKNKKSKKVAFLDIKPDEEIKITSEVPTETYSESPKESIVEVKLDLNVPDTSISTKSEETPTLDIKRESVETVTVFEPKAVQTSFSEGSEDAPVDTSVPSVTVPQLLKSKPQDKKSQVTDTKKPTKQSEDVSKPRSERKSQEKEKSPSDQEPKLPTSDVQVIKTFEEETRTFSPEDTIEIASVVVDTIIQVSEDSLRADRKKKANKGKENGRDKVSKEDSFKTKLPEDSQFSTLTKHDIDSIGVNVEIVTKVDPKPEGKSKDETDQSSGSKPRKSKSPEDRSGKKPETSTPSVKTEIPPTPSVRSSKKTKKGGEEIPESVKKSDVPTVKNISNVPQTPHTKGEKEISPENNKPDKTRAEKNKKTSKDIVQESKEEILPQEAIGTDRYKITNEFLNIEKVNRDYEPKEVQTSFSDEPSGIDEPSKKKVTIIDESEQTQESKGPTAKDKKSKADKKSKGEKEKTSKSSGEPVDQTDKFPSHKKSDTIKEKPKKPEEVSGDDKQLSKKEKSKSPEKSAEQTVKDASQKKLDTHKEKPLKPKAIDINEKQSHKVQKSKPSDDVHPVVATQTSLPDYSETIPDKSITTFTSEVVVTQNVKKRDDRQSPKNKKKKKSFLKIFFFALRIEFVVVVC